MGVRANISPQRLEIFFTAALTIVSNEIKRALSYLGEQSVKKARDRSQTESWFDQTGNLRSSIGYSIYEYGKKQIESAFSVVKNGSEGASEGRKMVEDLASLYSNTYAMVVVAAMNYADYVEAKDNKDVLASTELWAKSKVDEYLQKALKRADKKIKAVEI